VHRLEFVKDSLWNECWFGSVCLYCTHRYTQTLKEVTQRLLINGDCDSDVVLRTCPHPNPPRHFQILSGINLKQGKGHVLASPQKISE